MTCSSGRRSFMRSSPNWMARAAASAASLRRACSRAVASNRHAFANFWLNLREEGSAAASRWNSLRASCSGRAGALGDQPEQGGDVGAFQPEVQIDRASRKQLVHLRRFCDEGGPRGSVVAAVVFQNGEVVMAGDQFALRAGRVFFEGDQLCTGV